MWPVGLITKLGVSSPVVRNGKIDGFYDGWIAGRTFPVDMAGFAVSVEFLLSRPRAVMPFKPGYEEDGFLKSLGPFSVQEIELLASNCTKVAFVTGFNHFVSIITLTPRFTDFGLAHADQEERSVAAFEHIQI